MTTNNNAMLIVFIVLALGVGFLFGRMSVASPTVTSGTPATNSTTRTATEQTPAASTENTATVQSSDLTPGQRAMLTAMGIDADTFTITPAMIACAEAGIGATRVEEIKNGATPSMSEGVKLMACYK